MRIHQRLRRAKFTPFTPFNTECPIDIEQPEDYRKTIIRRPGSKQQKSQTHSRTSIFKNINKRQQNRILEGPAWIGETWFKPQPGSSPIISTGATASTPKQIQQEHTSTTRSQSARAASSGATAPATATTNIGVHTPIKDKPSSSLMTATGKQPARYSNIPSPSDVDMTSDYWIREGRLWKRVHIIPRTVLYCPEASDGGPPENLIPMRMTINDHH